MDHPNIARVLDAGETDAGRPYFVMELARGAPIAAYCDENRLTPRERLGLFVGVCRAVQHAHSKGVIHRDLKPSNVLVTRHDGAAVVKVIDFGIAKAVGPRLSDATCTYAGQLVGTPLYASPEQAGGGLDVDTRSDVYGLGALLYELLTGSPPFPPERFGGAGYDQICRIIRDEEPPRPSARVAAQGADAATACARRQSDPRRLGRLLRGELDWVVMKCLEKDRERRYETAAGLARDVERYLNDEPVQACSPSAWYRTRKFVRRHRAGLALACVALLLLLVGGGGFGWVAGDQVARQAALEQEVARALHESDNFQAQGRYPDALAAARRAEGLAAVGGSPELQRRVRERRADLEMVGRVDDLRMRWFEVKGGGTDNAWVDRAFAAAFREYGIDVEELPSEVAAERMCARTIRTELAMALDSWVEARRRARPKDPSVKRLVEVAQAVDPDAWRNQMRAAVWARDRNTLKGLASAADAQSVPAGSQAHLGGILQSMGERESAVRLLRAAQARHPDDFWINYYLGRSLGWLPVPEWDEAARCFAMAVALRPRHAVPHGALGWALLYKGSLEPCIAALRRAIELDDEYFDAHVLLAQALARTRRWDEALGHHHRSLALRPDNLWAHRSLSTTYFQARQPDRAIAALKDAVRLWPNHLDVRLDLARALTAQGKCDEACVHYTAAIDLCRDLTDGKHLRRERAVPGALRGAWAERGQLAADQQQWDKARADLARVHEADADDLESAASYAGVLLLAGDTQGYGRLSARLREADARQRCLDQAGRKSFLLARIGLLAPVGDEEAARLAALAEEAVRAWPRAAWYLHVLGLALYRAGRYDDAVKRLHESLRADPAEWPGHPINWLVLAMTHQRLGRPDEARQWLNKATQAIDDRHRGKPLSRTLLGMHAHDWSAYLILRREAEGLISGAGK
jgi:tetratricopeptide (TPR) repeat protein